MLCPACFLNFADSHSRSRGTVELLDPTLEGMNGSPEPSTNTSSVTQIHQFGSSLTAAFVITRYNIFFCSYPIAAINSGTRLTLSDPMSSLPLSPVPMQERTYHLPSYDAFNLLPMISRFSLFQFGSETLV